MFEAGALKAAGGYFVIRPGAPARTPFHNTAGTPWGYRHSHTYVAGDSSTRDDLLALIEDATTRIRMSSYLVGDEPLRAALERASRRLKGGIRVITDLGPKTEGVQRSEDSSETRARQNFEALSELGVAIRGYPGCHAKFAVIDDRVALVHSANFMTRAFATTGENGVVVSDRDEVLRAASFFDRLWRGASWEMDTTGRCTIAPRTPEPSGREPQAPQSKRGLIWTFHEEHSILSTIVDLVESAEHELHLATFNVSEMTRRPDLIYRHLEDAVSRGVRVRLLLRARSGAAAGVEAAALSDLGVELYPCALTHAKGVIADRARGALFSANFDARFGLDRDVELGVRLDDTGALSDALRFFEHSMAEHDRAFVRDPDARALALGWRTPPWPLADRVDLTADLDDWSAFSDATNGPVVFEQHSEALRLYAGHRAWSLVPDATQRSYVLRSGTPQKASALERLRDPLDRTGGVTPGLCTATFIPSTRP
jgi:phosphatidylserine/phosphatidylglycerophosphate/cardiolipin synthase-like enzyme